MDDRVFLEYLRECREWVQGEIQRWIPPRTRYREQLYDLVLDYPLREAKALRPALCLATSRALGGMLEATLPSAAVLELYHNAFLVHDDVEDGSEQRRGGQTLHGEHGTPIAINVGDAMLALTLRPLLDNTALVGLGRSLRVFEAISEMATTSAEGQALELHWIKRGLPSLDDELYLQMVEKKTAHYSFVTPLQTGAIIAGATDEQLKRLHAFGRSLGVAFQIRDDVLNLEQGSGKYGKELCGDLWEGKYTLILLHALRSASASDRERAETILAKERPRTSEGANDVTTLLRECERQLRSLLQVTDLNDVARRAISEQLVRMSHAKLPTVKDEADVAWLAALIERHGSLAYARTIGAEHAARARSHFESIARWMPESVHREFLAWLVDYVTTRDL